jgi:hypothetical protein
MTTVVTILIVLIWINYDLGKDCEDDDLDA